MKAVIVAAGKGTRLYFANDLPKPLIPICGKPLIEWIITTAVKGGTAEIVIVLGYRGNEIKEAVINKIAPNINCKIDFVENLRYEEANGISIAVTEQKTGKEDFLVLMSDHLIESSVISRLIGTSIQCGALLAVDLNISENPDIDDATKVKMAFEKKSSISKITDIGKNISNYNAIDMGCFRMTSDFFEAFRESENKGDTSISGAIRILAQKDIMNGLVIENAKWIDIDTPEIIPLAEKILPTLL